MKGLDAFFLSKDPLSTTVAEQYVNQGQAIKNWTELLAVAPFIEKSLGWTERKIRHKYNIQWQYIEKFP